MMKFKQISLLKKMVFLGFIVFMNANTAKTQNNYTTIDSLSKGYYLENNWTAMQSLFKEYHPDKYQSNVFYQRNAVAEYNLGNTYKAEKLIYKSLKLNRFDMFSLDLLHDVFIQKGEIDKAINLGKDKYGYQKSVWLNSIAIESGLKKAESIESGNLRHFGLSVRSRIGYKLHINQFFSFNDQQYFWEKFEQINYTLLPEYYLNKFWSIETPFQIADYKSKIAYEETTEALQNFDAEGSALQKTMHLGLNLKYSKQRHNITFGVSSFSSLTKAAYQLNLNFSDTIIEQTFDTSGSYSQQQINIDYQYVLPILKNKIRLGSSIFLIENQFGKFINIRPQLSIKAFKNGMLYFDYWHKNRYMTASPMKGIMINNYNTQTQRILASVQYFPAHQLSIEASYIYEFGKDLLYERPLNYHCVFLNIAYYFKP